MRWRDLPIVGAGFLIACATPQADPASLEAPPAPCLGERWTPFGSAARIREYLVAAFEPRADEFADDFGADTAQLARARIDAKHLRTLLGVDHPVRVTDFALVTSATTCQRLRDAVAAWGAQERVTTLRGVGGRVLVMRFRRYGYIVFDPDPGGPEWKNWYLVSPAMQVVHWSSI